MRTDILTSMFPDGFSAEAAELLRGVLTKRGSFAFTASEFERGQEQTDGYFRQVMGWFHDAGLFFEHEFVVDGRLTPAQARRAMREADVLWLTGGDTEAQFRYFQAYGLVEPIRRSAGVVIGMSAGAINMAVTSVCIPETGRGAKLYQGIGRVDISVAPHFARANVPGELLALSKQFDIYGLCDDAMLVCRNGTLELCGEVYRLRGGTVEPLSGGAGAASRVYRSSTAS